MIDAALRAMPLAIYQPLRQAVHDYPRRHPVRLVATAVLRRVLAAHRHHLHGRVDEICPLDAPGLTFEASDSMVMDAVYWFGVRGYEGTVARVWAALCARSRSVLEIGGNVGLFSVVGGAHVSGSYTVVEPVPANVAALRANLARNGLNWVEVLQAAVITGNARSDVTLHLPDEGRDMPVGAHLAMGAAVNGHGTHASIIVPGLPVRGLAAGRDLIKIDAEGIEAALLSDIRPLLLAERPALMIEVLPDAAALAALLSDLAAKAGYSIHVLPEYGSDDPVQVDAATFTAATPGLHRSKDVVLVVGPLPG